MEEQLHTSFQHPCQHYVVPGRNSPARESCYPHRKKESRVCSFPSLLVGYKKNLFLLHPTQRMAKLRHKNTAKHKEEEQGLPVSASIEHRTGFNIDTETNGTASKA